VLTRISCCTGATNEEAELTKLACMPSPRPYNASGTVSGIDDRSIIAVLVSAVKALASKVSNTAHLFAEAISAKVATLGETPHADKLCVRK
jgi:hypothetical protein